MMSLQTNQEPVLLDEAPFMTAIKQQYLFKLKTYHNFISTLIILQLLGFFLGLFNQSYWISTGYLDINIATISTDQAYIFTIIMAFIYGVQLTTKVAKNMMTTFVSDKRTNHLVNGLLLGTISLFGAILVALSGVCMRLLAYLFFETEKIVSVNSITIATVLMTILAMFVIFFFVSSLGYLIGELVQISKVFIVIVPVVAYTFQKQIASLFSLYSDVKSVALFTVLMLCTIMIVFLLSFVIGRKSEVRQV